jgi:predicted enzyme related to lactoylglutathione lyase
MPHLELVALVVRDYDAAIQFCSNVLQFAGRVGLFLRVDDFDVSYERMVAAGVRFVSPPREEACGRLAVFLDLEGSRWDLLGPDPSIDSTS